jgi:hypothetical protein
MSVRDMKKMLGRLRALGASMEILSVDEKEDGHAHVVFHNKDTYKGVWRDGKMNGYGTFRKNEVKKNQYEWQFCGEFKDDCATSGQLSTPHDPDGESRRSGSGGKPVYEWDPFPPPGERYTNTQDGPVSAERAAEIEAKNNATAATRREYRALVEKNNQDNKNEAERRHWEQFDHV